MRKEKWSEWVAGWLCLLLMVVKNCRCYIKNEDVPAWDTSSFLFFALDDLVILCLHLEVGLGVIANGADLRSLLANDDVTAVRALPDDVAVL